MDRKPGNNMLTRIRYRKPVAVILLVLSCMTFCVAKEVYDPHTGTGVDIFCKTLFAIGDDFDTAYVPENRFSLSTLEIQNNTTCYPQYQRSVDQIRAPPFIG